MWAGFRAGDSRTSRDEVASAFLAVLPTIAYHPTPHTQFAVLRWLLPSASLSDIRHRVAARSGSH
jgi:hypothetical protein